MIVADMMVWALLGAAVQLFASSAATGLWQGNCNQLLLFSFWFFYNHFSFDVPPAPAQGADKAKYWFAFAESVSLMLATHAHYQVCC
jgi:hypothetical protein